MFYGKRVKDLEVEVETLKNLLDRQERLANTQSEILLQDIRELRNKIIPEYHPGNETLAEERKKKDD